ncbi:hypothetical protein SPRG_17330 [Saprolegnia parasitica CBS 223.65]|uniref:Uncharacterized protein n=1 Tax=Saprolegnia parasitica (strain CBS 223.65) TaxID=695850 RepID=A0A067BQR8_SAPPC|nr:hypothetical protein SPRG_17330 [Saprolegnia parasitica CBS 223.65]KDO17027.1 hypothetical protein SPRG_17330 [Saprolegnia parasitica CBS 223.65]|eukprot:XP_012212264.1 hypothetical protein SPRG_17330 [Saprolegnia parasitica CBS 223.65]
MNKPAVNGEKSEDMPIVLGPWPEFPTQAFVGSSSLPRYIEPTAVLFSWTLRGFLA